MSFAPLKSATPVLALCASLAAAAPAAAQSPAQNQNTGFYIGGGGAASFVRDSDNDGVLTGDFTTGAGTTIPAGTVLPSGTDLSWTTEYDTGWGVFGNAGYRFANQFRVELELVYGTNDVDRHLDLVAAGIPLAAEDAGVLVTGSGNLGVTTADLLADGRGDTSIIAPMVNAYYDFALDGGFTPHVGFGVGYARVASDFRPSGVEVLDDQDWVFAFQAMAGLAYPIAQNVELFGGYRYLQTTQPEFDLTLLPGTLETQYRVHRAELGVRFFLN